RLANDQVRSRVAKTSRRSTYCRHRNRREKYQRPIVPRVDDEDIPVRVDRHALRTIKTVRADPAGVGHIGCEVSALPEYPLGREITTDQRGEWIVEYDDAIVARIADINAMRSVHRHANRPAEPARVG